MTSNQLLFTLQCMHCNAEFFSQASLRAHTKHGPPKCRQYCIRCGCCRDLFLERERLAFHLNQPGINKRPAASSPSEFITETCRAATATTHLAITSTTATPTLSRAAVPQVTRCIRPTVCDPGPPPPVLPSMLVFTGAGADLADWQGWSVEDWLPQEPANMSLDTSSLGQYEVISPAVSAIPTCTLATAATTSTPAAAPPRMMAPKKPPPQQRPSSPDSSVEESPNRAGSVRKEEGKEVMNPPPVPTAPPLATALGHRVATLHSRSPAGVSGSISQLILFTG